jgi:hypothetical protein
MARLLATLLCVASVGFATARAAIADPAASPSARAATAGSDEGAVRAKNAGTIEGEVTAVDYRAGTIAVQSGGRRVEVVVLPSTNIVGHDNFHTIADIQKGSRVQVILSERAGTFIAQIIKLR